MSYQSDICTALTAESTISDIIGSKLSWDIADGTVAAPYIVAQTISTGGETTHDGNRNIEFPLIQFSCWAKTKAAAISLASAVNAFVDGNTIGGASTVTFRFSNQITSYDEHTKLFGEILEYRATTNTN